MKNTHYVLLIFRPVEKAKEIESHMEPNKNKILVINYL